MRLHWIDSLKGFGIILVVLAHYSLPVAIDAYIFSFHMPLFFFISGFLFDFGKYTELATNFVNSRFRSLIMPYLYFAVLTGIFCFLLDAAYQPGVTNIEFFKSSTLYCIYSILYALGPLVSYNEPLWFLTCLFVTELLFYGFMKKCDGEPRKLLFWLTAAGVIGYIYSVYVPFRLPWNADVALSAIVFYGVGNIFRKITEKEEKSGAKLGIGSSLESNSKFREGFSRTENFFPRVIILLNLLYLAYLLKFPTDRTVDMNGRIYGGFFSFYLFAFSGIFAYYYIFKKIGSSKVLEYYGRNSLIVLVLHAPIINVLKKLMAIILDVDTEYFHHNAAFALSLTMLNLLCLIPFIFLINNYFPFLIGKRALSWSLKGLKAHLRNLGNFRRSNGTPPIKTVKLFSRR